MMETHQADSSGTKRDQPPSLFFFRHQWPPFPPSEPTTRAHPQNVFSRSNRPTNPFTKKKKQNLPPEQFLLVIAISFLNRDLVQFDRINMPQSIFMGPRLRGKRSWIVSYPIQLSSAQHTNPTYPFVPARPAGPYGAHTTSIASERWKILPGSSPRKDSPSDTQCSFLGSVSWPF